MITAINITNQDLESALEVLRVLKEHTEKNEPWAGVFLDAVDAVIEEYPMTARDIKLDAIRNL